MFLSLNKTISILDASILITFSSLAKTADICSLFCNFKPSFLIIPEKMKLFHASYQPEPDRFLA